MKTDDDASRIRGELHARIDPIIDELARELANRLTSDAIWMTIAEYAAHRKVSEKTVRKWVDAGMTGVNHRGRNIRIRFAEADGWSATKATLRSAELDAHGAKR